MQGMTRGDVKSSKDHRSGSRGLSGAQLESTLTNYYILYFVNLKGNVVNSKEIPESLEDVSTLQNQILWLSTTSTWSKFRLR